jgi:hypothetical protein
MLSHSADEKTEVSEVAPDASEMPMASENQRRHLTVADVLGHFDLKFFRNWFVDGPRHLLAGRFSTREGVFMSIAAVPALLAVAFLTVPGFLFSSPEQHAFYHFAQNLQNEVASLIPAGIGALSTLFSLRFPLSS